LLENKRRIAVPNDGMSAFQGIKIDSMLVRKMNGLEPNCRVGWQVLAEKLNFFLKYFRLYPIAISVFFVHQFQHIDARCLGKHVKTK
jgi:hypothetical protein